MAEYTICEKVRVNRKRLPIVIGDKFEEFTIVDSELYKTSTSNHIHVKCKCSCGKECYERLDHLRKGMRGSCYECSIYLKERNRKNVGQVTGAMFSNILGRSKERNIDFNLTMEYLNELYLLQEGRCAISGIEIRISPINGKQITVTASLDRINPSKGYEIGNVQWTHKRVNIMKGNMTQSDLIGICRLICNTNKDLQDNFDPSTLNGIFNKRVDVKEQRLIGEEPIQ